MSTTTHSDASASGAENPLDGWFLEQVADTALGAQTGGRSTTALVERSARTRGVMAPLYVRAESETVRVLEGELTFYVGNEVVRARVGDVVVAPGGVPHTFRVESEGARWLVLTRVASVRRFEDFGRALAAPCEDGCEDWPSADEAAALAAIGGANGILVLGPPGSLPAGA